MGGFEVTRGVAYRSVAALCIPTQHSGLRKGHAGEGFDALSELDVLGQGCNDVRSTHLVQNVACCSEEMRKSLAVFAIAHAPAYFFRVAERYPLEFRTGTAMDDS